MTDLKPRSWLVAGGREDSSRGIVLIIKALPGRAR